MRFIVAIIFLILIPGFFLGWIDTINYAFANREAYLPFLVGIVAYIALIGIQNRNFQHNLRWFQTFSHELTHLVFSLLTFNKIHGFNATSHSGGHIAFSGRINMLIILSPYCVPIFTLLLLLVSAVSEVQHEPFLVGAVGFSYMFHLHTYLSQTKYYQPDLLMYGLIPSYSFIILINLFFSGIIIMSVSHGLSAFKAYFDSVYRHSGSYLYPLLSYFQI